jgi:hypothetical protein
VIGDPQQKKKTKVDNAKKEMKTKCYMHAPVQKKIEAFFSESSRTPFAPHAEMHLDCFS